MEQIAITFLGTGNAVPTKLRNHTAILVSFANENILIDCGEGTQRQFKIAEISPTKLTKLLITHWHGDHILGIPGLLQTLSMSEYQKNLEIYGPRGTKNYMHLLQELFREFHIKTKIEEVSGKVAETPLSLIEAMPMAHGTPTNGYSIVLKDRTRLDKSKLRKLNLPNSPILKELQEGRDIIVNGKKIKASQISYTEKGKKVTIILDTGMTDNAVKLAKDSDLLICEATFSDEEQEKAAEYKHLTAAQAATIAKKAKAKRLILTHISQRYEHNLSVIEKEAKKIFKNTQIVKDFDIITI
ncbi:MAG TPA: ribonuclease Z [Candidatus Nanoarchaeia archaeon]|nr:ribonuclease Z [Candidatus Nanoarchaeia archaeon]